MEHILEWFQEEARRETSKLDAFCAAFPGGDAEAVCREALEQIAEMGYETRLR